jgi:hypothetical protein
MRLLLVCLAVCAAPVSAQLSDDGPVVEGRAADQTPCPEDWQKRRQGGCWTKHKDFTFDGVAAYVHPGGWVVDPRCFDNDPRFTRDQLLKALDDAQCKIDPKCPLAKGGCMSHFNPAWGKRLKDEIWDKRMYLSCPEVTKGSVCADQLYDGYRRINILAFRNAKNCIDGDTGLSGTIFHESLHAAGEDTYAVAVHNRAWEMRQIDFIRDRVYGTEMVCYLGTSKSKKKREMVNLLQCLDASENHKPLFDDDRQADRLDAAIRKRCEFSNRSFTDMPVGIFKHGDS